MRISHSIDTNYTHQTAILLTTLALMPLVVFLFLATAPTITDKASATTATSETNVNIEEVLSLRIVKQDPSTGEWDIDTDTIEAVARYGTFGHSTVKVIASTNAPGGYTLSFNDVDNNTSLASTAVSDTIPTLSGDRTLADLDDSTDQFPENAWGYNWVKDGDLTNYTFSPVPSANASSSEKQLDDTSSKGIGTYSFTLGVRASEDLAAATYQDQVLFTLVGNPAPSSPLFFRTTYMDQFNSTICNTVDTPSASVTTVTNSTGTNYVSGGTIVPSTTIIDRRDGQEYTIRKLADGNCWMTENLRLGKKGTVTLNDQNSNMSSGRTFNVPAATTTVGTSWDSQDEYPFVFYRDSNPGAVNPTVKPEGVTPDGPSSLYNWYTATAGARDASGNSLMTATSGQAADSVCPKGWQLPINGSGYTTSKSYMNLINVYTGATENSYAQAGTEQGTIIENRIKTMLGTPLSFIYSDHYYYGGTLYSRPVGLYWSSSVNSATYSYGLNFNTDGTNRHLGPQSNYYKGNAYAVRCVAQ